MPKGDPSSPSGVPVDVVVSQPAATPGVARDWWRKKIVDLADDVEDAIYFLVAALLVVAGLFLLWSTVTSLYREMTATAVDPLALVLSVLDRGLVLFIIAELLHTVRITIQDRSLTAGPFLIVGLIAGIRRILILTAEIERGFRWNPEGIELVILIALIGVMTAAALFWHRIYRGPHEIIQ